ncbi:MAG TPA: hypothetical protein VKR31_04795 [Rhizomicrobium sp.]|nr:hypothetical protein [Rhizomicrobium sp.]
MLRPRSGAVPSGSSARFADRLVSTDFSHGDFFTTIRHLRTVDGIPPDAFNWNVTP